MIFDLFYIKKFKFSEIGSLSVLILALLIFVASHVMAISYILNYIVFNVRIASDDCI